MDKEDSSQTSQASADELESQSASPEELELPQLEGEEVLQRVNCVA